MSEREELETSTYPKKLPPYIKILVPEELISAIGIIAKEPKWNFGWEILVRAGKVYGGLDDNILPAEKRKQKIVPGGSVQMQINSGRRDLAPFWKEVNTSFNSVK